LLISQNAAGYDAVSHSGAGEQCKVELRRRGERSNTRRRNEQYEEDRRRKLSMRMRHMSNKEMGNLFLSSIG